MDSLTLNIQEDAWEELRRIFAKILIILHNHWTRDRYRTRNLQQRPTEEDFPDNAKAQREFLNEMIFGIKDPYWASNYYSAEYYEFVEEMLNLHDGQDATVDTTYYPYELGICLETITNDLYIKDVSNLASNFEYLFDFCEQLNIDGADEAERVETYLSILAVQESKLIYIPKQNLIYIPKLIIEVQQDLIRKIAQQPNLIFSIPPRKFEEIIAELFSKRGYAIELTKATRDGGRDIIAIFDHMHVRTKYIIECKRYASNNKVSLGIVQRLLGVKIADCANKAILATTSTFTKEARFFANNHIWDLDLKDYDDILSWIKAYR